MGTFLKNRILQSGSTAIVLPHGTTANRPSNPVFGAFRYNTSTGTLEFFNGSIYKTVASTGEANITVDSFTGDNSTLTFTLSTTVSAADQTIVFVSNIYQQPTGVYTITGGGTDITFSAAPLASEPINVIHGLGNTP
jgi:hypothetical protein|tara:strand:- start:40 stop:450 length:411 start_codon:yes stop_codon:yes gene_type:complete